MQLTLFFTCFESKAINFKVATLDGWSLFSLVLALDMVLGLGPAKNNKTKNSLFYQRTQHEISIMDIFC